MCHRLATPILASLSCFLEDIGVTFPVAHDFYVRPRG